MTFQSIIQVRGIQKPIIVSKANAEKVREIFENKSYEPDYIIRIDRYSFRKADIKSIEVNRDGSTGESWSKSMADFYVDEKSSYEKRSKLTPERKSEYLDMFVCLYTFAMDDRPSPEKLREAYHIQIRFFTENKKRTICDPDLFKSIIPFVKSKRINIFTSSFFTLVRKAVIRDIELAR